MAAILIGNRSDPHESKVTGDELKWIQQNPGRCPDCYGNLLAGPEGGASQNVLCEDCLHKFNLVAGGIWVERIGVMPQDEAIRYGIKPITDSANRGEETMKIGISTFAQKNVSDPELLIGLIRAAWHLRKPGAARTDLSKVVLVPIPPQDYKSRTVAIPAGVPDEDVIVRGFVTRRAENEDPYIVNKIVGIRPKGLRGLLWRHGLEIGKPIPVAPEPVKFVNAVLYSAETLLENGGWRTPAENGGYDWEVVAVVASSVENEPMEPLTMARNWLSKPGGTPAPYTLQQIMEAIYFWSGRAKP